MCMRHPDRPCMKRNMREGEEYDNRSPEQIACDPYDTNKPECQAARANQLDSPTPAVAPHGFCDPFPSTCDMSYREAQLELKRLSVIRNRKCLG